MDDAIALPCTPLNVLTDIQKMTCSVSRFLPNISDITVACEYRLDDSALNLPTAL